MFKKLKNEVNNDFIAQGILLIKKETFRAFNKYDTYKNTTSRKQGKFYYSSWSCQAGTPFDDLERTFPDRFEDVIKHNLGIDRYKLLKKVERRT